VVVRDDPDVNWSEGSSPPIEVGLRDAAGGFLAWGRAVPRMLNSVEVFAWNTDKAYLAELAAIGVPSCRRGWSKARRTAAAIAEVSEAARVSAVVKPAGGCGLGGWAMGGAPIGGVGTDRRGDFRARPRRQRGLAGAEAPGCGRDLRARGLRRYDDPGHAL